MRLVPRSLRHLWIDNPLLRWRWSRANAYGWPNAILFVFLLLGVAGGAFRFLDFLNARHMVASLPSAFREAVAERLALQFSDNHFGGDPYGMEFYGLFLIALALLGCHFWLLVASMSGRSLNRRRWDFPWSDEMRILPVTTGQILLARYDWPLVKGMGVLFVVWTTLLWPSRIPFVWPNLLDLHVRPEWMLWIASLTIFSVQWALHRTAQRFRVRKFTLPCKEEVPAWIALLLPLLAAGVAYWACDEMWDSWTPSGILLSVTFYSSLVLVVLGNLYLLLKTVPIAEASGE